METLQVLEQKIIQLVTLIRDLQTQIKDLKVENKSLVQKNADLILELDGLRSSTIAEKEVFQEEKALAKLTVDEIIKNIDSLVSNQDHL